MVPMQKSTCLWTILGLVLIISHQFGKTYTGSLISVAILSTIWMVWLKNSHISPRMSLCLVLALGLRILLFLTNGVFEDDWHRYRAEGLLLGMGINVYSLTPAEVLAFHLDKINAHPQRAEIVYHLAHTGFPEYPAIYPKELIFIFGFVPSLLWLFLITDLTVLLIFQRISHHIFYLWCFHPLILMEGFVNKHYDVLLVLPLVLAYQLMQSHKMKFQILSGLFWGLIFSLKGMALFLWILLPPRQKVLSLFALLGFIAWAYFSSPDRFSQESSLVIFAKWWEVNSPMAYLIRMILQNHLSPENTALWGRAFMGLLLILLIYWKRASLKSSTLICVMMLANPINNPWYLILPLAYGLLQKDWNANWLPVACLGYYSCWIADDPGISLLIYVPLSLVLPLWYLWTKQNSGPPRDSPD